MTLEGGVFVKQVSADIEVISLSHNPSKSPKKKEKRRWTRSSCSSWSSSSSRSKSPLKEVQDVNITRTRNVDAIIPLPVHQFRLLSADLHQSPTFVNTSSKRRFQIITEEEEFQYSIPGDMAKYVNENVDRFSSDKDLIEYILKEKV